MLTDSGLDTYLRKHTAQEEQNLLGATNDYPGIETITTASGELCYCFTPTPLSMQMALSENKVLATNGWSFAMSILVAVHLRSMTYPSLYLPERFF